MWGVIEDQRYAAPTKLNQHREGGLIKAAFGMILVRVWKYKEVMRFNFLKLVIWTIVLMFI